MLPSLSSTMPPCVGPRVGLLSGIWHQLGTDSKALSPEPVRTACVTASASPGAWVWSTPSWARALVAATSKEAQASTVTSMSVFRMEPLSFIDCSGCEALYRVDAARHARPPAAALSGPGARNKVPHAEVLMSRQFPQEHNVKSCPPFRTLLLFVALVLGRTIASA